LISVPPDYETGALPFELREDSTFTQHGNKAQVLTLSAFQSALMCYHWHV
jgi:hypothetical protein